MVKGANANGIGSRGMQFIKLKEKGFN